MKAPDTTAIKSSVQDRLPQQESAGNDLVAGLTFALVNIPQAMANALLALVNPVSGLYTLMIGMPIAAIFTGTRLMNVSTTSALSVAAGSALMVIPSESRAQNLIVLVVLVGLIQFLAGIFKLGTAIRFVSNAVMVGFTTGVSLLIILGQLDDFTGYDSPFTGRITSALDTLLNIDQWQLSAAVVGAVVLVLILVLSRTRYTKIAYIVALVAGTLMGVLINAVYPGAVQNIPPIPDQLFNVVRPDFQYLSILIPSALGIAIIGLIQAAGVAMGMTLASSLIMPLQYAVFVGVAISVMMHVLQSSARVRLVELVPVAGGFPIERDAPAQLKSESVTILMPYGDVFFAAASNMESLMPDAGSAKRAVVIFILRGREEVGSTFIGVLRRYAEALQANDGRLYLGGVSPQLFEQLRRTGIVSLLGQERIMTYHRQFGTSANRALTDAYNWLGVPVQYASEEIIEESSP